MDLRINSSSRKPIYVQIVEQIKGGIASGELSAGTRLMPVRKLATKLEVSRLTVFRAYTELQEAGLVKGTPGRGTTVAPIKNGDVARDSMLQLFHGAPAAGTGRSRLRNDVRSLATIAADPELFDAESWLADMFDLRTKPRWLFYYPEHLGEPEMRTAGAELLRRLRPDVADDEVVVFGRSADALGALARSHLGSGAHVVLQEPNALYSESLHSGLGLVPHGVGVGEDGIDVEHVEMLAKRHGVAAAFVQPTFGYGDGRVWPEHNRLAFLEAAERHGILVIELLGSSPINFREQLPRNLFALAPPGLVLAELDFSCALAPGLGLGVAYVPQKMRAWYAAGGQLSGTPPDKATQLTMARMIRSGRYDAHYDRAVPIYRARRDALLSALREHLPDTYFPEPEGGFAVDLHLPGAIDAQSLLEASVRAGVPVMPGRFLTTRGRGLDRVRLGYSMLAPEALRKAIARWAPVLKGHLGSARRTGTM